MLKIQNYEFHFVNSITQRDVERWESAYYEKLVKDKNGVITPCSESEGEKEKLKVLLSIMVEVIKKPNDKGGMDIIEMNNNFLLDLHPQDYIKLVKECSARFIKIFQKKN